MFRELEEGRELKGEGMVSWTNGAKARPYSIEYHLVEGSEAKVISKRMEGRGKRPRILEKVILPEEEGDNLPT